MLEDCLEVIVTALGKTMENIIIGFIRQGDNLIQTDHSSVQLLGNHGYIFALDLGKTFALKNLQKDLEIIDDVASHNKNLIQN